MSDLDLELRGPAARLTLNRPRSRNALSPSLLEALVDACGSLGARDDVRVVVLRGAGGAFSAGADLPAFLTRLGTEDAEAAADLGRRAAEALAALPQITVAAIEGACVGGGMVLAGACDLRWAAHESTFCVPELELGIPLAWGGMERLVHLLGETVAADLVLTGRRFDAVEAKRIGFLSTVLDAPFDATVDRQVDLVASRPAGALRTTKRQLGAIRAGRFDARADAAALLAALHDPESQRAAQEYIARRVRSKG
jgi:enoyl-CoA hydratase/carnithine racemase